MSPRARPSASRLGRTFVALAAAASALAIAGCTRPADVSLAITPEPTTSPELTAPPENRQGAAATGVPIEFAPLGFKITVAVPADGHLCVLVPESAQDPTSCMGLDPAPMLDALPEGPERPFGVALARMGEWAYTVILSPYGTGIESREDIEEFVVGREQKGIQGEVEKFFADPEKAASKPASLVPKLFVDTPNQKFDLLQVNKVPVVKFAIEAPYPDGSPQYEAATTVTYVAFGQRAAMVTFLTSPKDIERAKPYIDATIQSLVMPPREHAELFGKPRAELDQNGTRTAIMIFGPLVALGGLLFLWLARSKKAEDDAVPAPVKGTSLPKNRKLAPTKAEDAAPEEEDDASGDGKADSGGEAAPGDDESPSKPA